jgi:hypothetical protein
VSDRVPVAFDVTDDPHDSWNLQPGDVGLRFTKIYNPSNRERETIPLTVAELRQAREAIDAYLAVHDTFLGT